jgi:hypothetical protein
VQLYMQAEDWLNAIQSLNVALQLDPAHAALHDQLGEGTFGCALGYGKERKVRVCFWPLQTASSYLRGPAPVRGAITAGNDCDDLLVALATMLVHWHSNHTRSSSEKTAAPLQHPQHQHHAIANRRQYCGAWMGRRAVALALWRL